MITAESAAAYENLPGLIEDFPPDVRFPRPPYNEAACYTAAETILQRDDDLLQARHAACVLLQRATIWHRNVHRPWIVRNSILGFAADVESLEGCVLESAASGHEDACIGLLFADCEAEDPNIPCQSERELHAWTTIYKRSFDALRDTRLKDPEFMQSLSRFSHFCPGTHPKTECVARLNFKSSLLSIFLFLAAEDH